jgi:hypothetical protein
VACLNPSDSFFIFNKEKLICLAHFYPSEFSIMDLMVFGDQLDMHIIYRCNDDEFSGIKSFASLAKKMVKTNNDNLERVFQIEYIYAWYKCLSNCHYFYKLKLL